MSESGEEEIVQKDSETERFVAKKSSRLRRPPAKLMDNEDNDEDSKSPWKGYEPRQKAARFIKGWFECACGKVVQWKHVLARHINQENLREGGTRHKEVKAADQGSEKHFNYQCKVCGNYYEH